MITNKQYKDSMLALGRLIATGARSYLTDTRHEEFEKIIESIPNDAKVVNGIVWDDTVSNEVNYKRMQEYYNICAKATLGGFDPNEHESKSWPYVNTKVKPTGERLEDPPLHDEGNILHIPSEDD